MTTEPWQTRAPDLIADVLIYPTEEGGRATAIQPGYGCPCFTEKQTRVEVGMPGSNWAINL